LLFRREIRMKRTFSWPLFLATAAVLTAVTWFLVHSRETRIAGTISAIVIAWGFVRYCVIVDDAAETAAEAAPSEFQSSEDADSLVRNDLWSRRPSQAATPERFEEQLKLPLLAVIGRPAPTAGGHPDRSDA
jgi:hypothetical protein